MTEKEIATYLGVLEKELLQNLKFDVVIGSLVQAVYCKTFRIRMPFQFVQFL